MFSLKQIPVFLLIASSSGVFAADARQERKKRIAILPIASSQPKSGDASFAGEIIRSELTSAAVFDVIANDQVESQLKLLEKKQKIGAGSCSSKECAIDVGNALESELIFAGKLVQSSTGSILISGKVINVVTQKEEYSAIETAPSAAELEKSCKSLVAKLNLWVTDANFMKEMRDKDLENEKSKMIDRNPQRGSSFVFEKSRDFLRIGILSSISVGDTTKTYFGAPIGLNLGVFLMEWGTFTNNIALYLHAGWRYYFRSDAAKALGFSANTLSVADGGIGLRYAFGVKGLEKILQPYIVVSGKFSYVSEAATRSSPSGSLTNTYTGIGGLAGIGFEHAIRPSRFVVYIEADFGYSPLGKNKENIDGWLFHGGIAIRI